MVTLTFRILTIMTGIGTTRTITEATVPGAIMKADVEAIQSPQDIKVQEEERRHKQSKRTLIKPK